METRNTAQPRSARALANAADAPDRQLPPIITGMAQAELQEFKWWITECLSMDFDTATPDQLHRAAISWIDLNYAADR